MQDQEALTLQNAGALSLLKHQREVRERSWSRQEEVCLFVYFLIVLGTQVLVCVSVLSLGCILDM